MWGSLQAAVDFYVGVPETVILLGQLCNVCVDVFQLSNRTIVLQKYHRVALGRNHGDNNPPTLPFLKLTAQNTCFTISVLHFELKHHSHFKYSLNRAQLLIRGRDRETDRQADRQAGQAASQGMPCCLIVQRQRGGESFTSPTTTTLS